MKTKSLRETIIDLPEWERERLTMTEVGIDEALSILDRHKVSPNETAYQQLKALSALLNVTLARVDGMQRRHDRLVSVRDKLDATFPSPQSVQ